VVECSKRDSQPGYTPDKSSVPADRDNLWSSPGDVGQPHDGEGGKAAGDASLDRDRAAHVAGQRRSRDSSGHVKERSPSRQIEASLSPRRVGAFFTGPVISMDGRLFRYFADEI